MAVLKRKRGQFAVALTEALEDRGKDILWLAKQINMTYEHVRKLCRGLAFPSLSLLKNICRALDLKEDAMWQLIVADKVERKYGKTLPMESPSKSARASEIEPLLPKLTDEQFQDLLGMARLWVRRNRKR
jgi:transcriptional regulator with XRE-family HTH domain